MSALTTTTHRRNGRPPLTSRQALLDVAVEHGFRGLTIGAVTTNAGVKYSTFYRHFPSLDALVDALVEDVLVNDPVSDPVSAGDGWRAELHATAARLAAVLTEWPGMADAIASMEQPPTWLRRAWARGVDALVDAGMPTGAAVAATDTVLTVAGLGPLRGCRGGVELVLDGIAARLEDTRAGRVDA